MVEVYFFYLGIIYDLPGKLSLGEFSGEIDNEEIRSDFDQGIHWVVKNILEETGNPHKTGLVSHTAIRSTYLGPKFIGTCGQERDSNMWITLVQYLMVGLVNPYDLPKEP